MSMFEIQYGPRWKNENGVQIFNVTDMDKTAEITKKQIGVEFLTEHTHQV